jgi:hypothetical protein
MRTVFVAVLGLGLLAGLVGLVGCQAQREVAADRIKESIDGLLGKLDVRHKEVKIQLDALEDGVGKVRTAKIKHQVLLQQIAQRTEPLTAERETVKKHLQTVQTALKSGTEVNIGGQTLSQEKLTKAAKELIDKHKLLDSQIKSAEATKPNLEKQMAALEKQQLNYTQQIALLKTSLKKIEADMISAKAYQEASAAMGDADASLAQNVDNLKGKLAELDAEVQTVLLNEGEKFNESSNAANVSEAEEVLKTLEGSADVSSEIDAILGTGDNGAVSEKK